MRLFVWCRVFSPCEKEERGSAAQGGFLLLSLFTPFSIGRQIFTGVSSLQLGTAKLLAYTEAMKSESNKILEIFPILLSAVSLSLRILINENFQICIFLLNSVLFLCVNDVRHFFIYFLHFLTQRWPSVKTPLFRWYWFAFFRHFKKLCNNCDVTVTSLTSSKF